MTTETPDVPPRSPRWLYAGLIASLAVNLLVAGGVGAAYWHHRHGPGGGRGGDFGLMGFVRELPAERQAIVRNEVSAARQATQPLRSAVREIWLEANKELTAEPFDKDKFKAAMARVSEAEARYKGAISEALAETAAKLSAEERRALQTWREKRKPRMFGRHKTGEGPDAKNPAAANDAD